MRWALLLGALALAGVANASTFYPQEMTCPVGGEKFTFQGLASISTFGQLPDGMPIGSGYFPVAMPQCPKNGLVMYKEYDAAQVKLLAPIVASPEYQAARKTETPYYLAVLLAKGVGDTELVPWLLQSAWWDAKNTDPTAERTRRYGTEFVALVTATPADPFSLTSIALYARAANALRELGRLPEAEALRKSIVITPRPEDKGKERDEDGNITDEYAGWTTYLHQLAGTIARGDTSREPIDMMNDRFAAMRCVDPERKTEVGSPLTAFEQDYCARPQLAEKIATIRKAISE